ENQYLTAHQEAEQTDTLVSGISSPILLGFVMSLDESEDGSGDEAKYKVWKNPPFLLNMSKQAKKDYAKIYKHETMTKQQQTEAMKAWAVANNVTVPFTIFDDQLNAQKKRESDEITSAVEQLHGVLSQIEAIEDNQKITAH
ncbi:hypothetical protein PFISCL1PPCAC_13665, partial [Pristionchus fissidentatus]